MSYLLYREHIDRPLYTHHERVLKNVEKIADEYRGYKWPAVIVPQHLRLGARFGDVLYFGEKTLHDERKRRIGILVDRLVLGSISQYKRLISKQDPKKLDLIGTRRKNEATLKRSALNQVTSTTYVPTRELKKLADQLAKFETSLMGSLVHFEISNSPRASRDQILFDSIPMDVEYEIDVTDMGFADKVTPDFVFHEPLAIGELKTGHRSDKHRISVAGYALAYEKQYRKDVNVGFVMYLDLNSSSVTPVFKLDTFVITDVLRTVFVEKMYLYLNALYKKRQPSASGS